MVAVEAVDSIVTPRLNAPMQSANSPAQTRVKPLKRLAEATGLEPATFGVTGPQFPQKNQLMFRLFHPKKARQIGF
jgi:hypothetical protein